MSRVVSADFLAATLTGFQALFHKSMAQVTTDYQRLAQVVESVTDQESYNWLGSVPAMREWVGNRQFKGLLAHDFTIVNKKYEATIEVDRETYEDEKLGLIRPRIEELAVRAAQHPDELLFTLLNAGFTTTCYDGQYFFDTDHSEGDSGSQSNKVTTDFGSAAVKAGITAMMGFLDDQGKPLGIVPDVLVVSPADLFEAREILQSTTIVIAGTAGAVTERGATNTLSGMLDLIVNPHVTSGYWALFSTRQIWKPFIFQWRIKPEFNGVTDPSDEYVFSTDAFKYGVRSRCNAGYAMWQTGYGSTGAG